MSGNALDLLDYAAPLLVLLFLAPSILWRGARRRG
jgi:hypothetical protein